MYHILIMQCVNGWNVKVMFENHIDVNHVFNKKEDLLKFLNENLPIMEKGFIDTIKKWATIS